MKTIITSLIISGLLIFGAIYLSSGNNENLNNVESLDGKQVVTIKAKGGYFPANTVVKAGTPTILKIKTSGTFDCSSALVIPGLDYRTNLPRSGETLIEIPPQDAGSTLQGICAMGMYGFTIDFN